VQRQEFRLLWNERGAVVVELRGRFEAVGFRVLGNFLLSIVEFPLAGNSPVSLFRV
jgi:hypothetical protein